MSLKTKFQDSPVEHLKRMKKLLKNPLKLALSVIPSPVGFTYPNKFMPKTLYKNKTKNKRAPIFAKAGKVSIKVANIILRLFALLMSFRTLAILKVLIILVAEPIF